MTNFENEYNKHIASLYGTNFEFTNVKSKQHFLSIEDRELFELGNVYTIDPAGCLDADDGFSIYENKNKLFLAIHIADPTEFICLKSQTWKEICLKTTTKYLSNNKPHHMMPENIIEMSSLINNSFGSQKPAISVITQIDKVNFEPVGNVNIKFTKVNVYNTYRFSYLEASKLKDSNSVIQTGLLIGKALFEIRSKNTVATKLNSINNSYILYEKNQPYLYCDSPSETKIKNMIAEFAIFSNSFVGQYLKANLKGAGIFRSCVASDWLDAVDSTLDGMGLLEHIIQNGIRADYISTRSHHDLVGMPTYTHFTSPIRRLSDCVCHYLLKGIYKKVHVFTEEELEKYSTLCHTESRNVKKIQYEDNKFRMIQCMYNMLEKNENVKICFYFSSLVKNRFLNIIICKINNHNVYISYSLKVKNKKENDFPKEKQTIDLTTIQFLNEMGRWRINELDDFFTVT